MAPPPFRRAHEPPGWGDRSPRVLAGVRGGTAVARQAVVERVWLDTEDGASLPLFDLLRGGWLPPPVVPAYGVVARLRALVRGAGEDAGTSPCFDRRLRVRLAVSAPCAPARDDGPRCFPIRWTSVLPHAGALFAPGLEGASPWARLDGDAAAVCEPDRESLGSYEAGACHRDPAGHRTASCADAEDAGGAREYAWYADAWFDCHGAPDGNMGVRGVVYRDCPPGPGPPTAYRPCPFRVAAPGLPAAVTLPRPCL